MADIEIYEPIVASGGDPEFIYLAIQGRSKEDAEKVWKQFQAQMNANQLRAFEQQVTDGEGAALAGPTWLISGPMWYFILALRKPIGPPTYEQWLEENK